MIPRNNSITQNEILQNQFSAYVTLAIRRQRIHYIKKIERKNSNELLFSPLHTFMPSENDPFAGLAAGFHQSMIFAKEIKGHRQLICCSRV